MSRSDGSLPNFWDLAYSSAAHLDYWDPGYPPQELVALLAAEAAQLGERALDLGCGAGREAIFLTRHGFTAIGVDSSQEALALARTAAYTARVSAHWCRASALSLPFADDAFHLVTDRGCFHIIAPAQRRRFAQQVRRVLAPGGLFLLRGASRTDEEEGLFAVNARQIDRFFGRRWFTRGPVLPLTMPSTAGNLAGNLVLLRRRKTTAGA